MPKFNHEDLEAVLNVIYRKGTITAVDSENDTADVDVPGGQSGSGVPIYYHCEPDSELRSNGAIYGAAAGFSAGSEDDPEDGDEVIVMCDTEGVPLRIIGFVDGIKSCVWEPWNADPEDKYNFATTNPWEIGWIEPGFPVRQPFEMVAGSLVYSVQTGPIWNEPGGVANDGLELDMRTENIEFRPIAPTELYIKINCEVSLSDPIESPFYNILFIFGSGGERLFIILNSTWWIYHEWTKPLNNWFLSLPTATETFYNVVNDGTIPIPLTPLNGSDIVYMSIETGYDCAITSTFSIDFINFK